MENDRPKASKVPRPIDPVRGGGSTRFVAAPRPANWDKWEHHLSAELWKAVALAHDFEPDSIPVNWGNYSDPFADWPTVSRDIRIACDHAENGQLKWRKTWSNHPSRNAVDLSDFGGWWLSRGWDLPPRFPRKLQSPAPSPSVVQQQTPRKARSQTKREMYDAWLRLAVEHCLTNSGQRRTREQIAEKIADDEGARDPFNGKQPAANSVLRRLNAHHPGWAEKSWTEREGRKNLPAAIP